MKNCSCNKKTVFDALILANEKFGERLYKMRLELSGIGAEVFRCAVPGQFAQFDARFVALPPADKIPPQMYDKVHKQMILRRPFSFSSIEPLGDKVIITVLYLVLGPSTLRMTTLTLGDKLGVIGPLGNGFWVPQNKKLGIIVAGGMGAPPLQHLASHIKKNFPQLDLVAFAGARSKSDLPFSLRKPHDQTELSMVLEEFARYGIQSHISTDDGSLGFKGFVTQSLAKWLKQNNINRDEAIIYSCGPDPMLSAVSKLAAAEKIDCQVSTERMMGCGIGICQSCAVECVVPGQQETVYKLCCTDGPVFNSTEVVWK